MTKNTTEHRVFSRSQSLLDAIAVKCRRARVQARQGSAEMKLKHAGWVRDASGDNPNYTNINLKITEEIMKKQARNEIFTRKLHQDG